ncbi:hypothetical protein H072_4181 [Dactylellina haptotyla CBS 200.50]|uniref:Uncharacterized protein n=1 Tax=Dactylellina haptotyla (strain CBS 200.50) TaxID=1284197 RepID=S8AGA0_DACHA|nr:hypothetical protein H072_4181 [Dactylellina haptotyla CBS 200.50]
MPPFRGPLYDAAADPKVFKSNKQAWEVERKPLETGLKKGRNGRSISYPIVKPGVVDGMVYYQREVVDPVLNAGQNGVPADEDEDEDEDEEDEEDEEDRGPDDGSVNYRVIRELNDFLAASEEESRPDAVATNGDGDEITEIQYTKEPVAEDSQEEEESVYEVYPEALRATEQSPGGAQLVDIQET